MKSTKRFVTGLAFIIKQSSRYHERHSRFGGKRRKQKAVCVFGYAMPVF